jgi:hypothetical protein
VKGAIFYLRNDMDANLGAFRACSLGTLSSLLEEKPTPSALVFPKIFRSGATECPFES